MVETHAAHYAAARCQQTRSRRERAFSARRCFTLLRYARGAFQNRLLPRYAARRRYVYARAVAMLRRYVLYYADAACDGCADARAIDIFAFSSV